MVVQHHDGTLKTRRCGMVVQHHHGTLKTRRCTVCHDGVPSNKYSDQLPQQTRQHSTSLLAQAATAVRPLFTARGG